MWRLVIVAVATVLAGCASVGRASQYQSLYADAHDMSGTVVWQIRIHPMEDTLLMEERIPLLSAEFFVPPRAGPDLALAAAVRLLGDTGCMATEVRQMVAPWHEVSFVCPADVDIRALARDQREMIRGGSALRAQ
jgi:hypothetical protein